MVEIAVAFAVALGVFIAIVISYLVPKFQRWQKRKYEPVKATTFTCADGHVVRSKGEMIIDNWLSEQRLTHTYEKTIYVGRRPIKYDWFLPETKTYVEYWGFGGKKYMRRKQEKLALYQAGKLHLVSVEDADLANIYTYLPVKFDLSSSNTSTRFCPHCGEPLDPRFK